MRYRFSIRAQMIIIVTGPRLHRPADTLAVMGERLVHPGTGGITIGIPAAVANVGDRRAFWVGFAVCGWVYFVFPRRREHQGGRPPASARRSWTRLTVHH